MTSKCSKAKFTNVANVIVLISNPTTSEIGLTILRKSCEVFVSPGFDKASVLKYISGVDALFWINRLKLDREVLDAAGPQLKIVGAMSTGYNHIDLKELKARGIKLTNVPNILDNAVADTAILLALGASRRVTEGRWHLERGTWKPEFDLQWMLGQDISGAAAGIIGLGGIGQAIARRVKGFEVSKILYTGHREKPEGRELGAQFVNLDTLTRESDFIFLAAPLTEETHQMCNADFFTKMKSTGIFVNISRGPLVDQIALISALKEGQIFAAGLDVMIPEPLNTDSELLKLPNVFLTPHTGAALKNVRDAMAELTANNILRGLAGEELLTPVQL